MSFQAKIKLSNQKNAPLTHNGFKGRALKKGEGFTTTSREEYEYYKAQPGFICTIVKGKLKRDESVEIDPPDGADLDGDHDDVEEEHDGDEGEETVEDAAVTGGYLRADLKKLSTKELKALIESDEDLPLRSRDLPKGASKKEIVKMILDAQRDKQRGEE